MIKMSINKVIYGNEELVNLTDDTVTKDVLLNGVTAHDKKGTSITGTLFSGFPDTVTISKVTQPTAVNKKEKNIVKYGNKTLIDLSGDTVTENELLFGYKCHRKDGTIILGNFLKDYPSSHAFSENLLDSSGRPILDSSGSNITAQIFYEKSTSGNDIIYKKK